MKPSTEKTVKKVMNLLKKTKKPDKKPIPTASPSEQQAVKEKAPITSVCDAVGNIVPGTESWTDHLRRKRIVRDR